MSTEPPASAEPRVALTVRSGPSWIEVYLVLLASNVSGTLLASSALAISYHMPGVSSAALRSSSRSSIALGRRAGRDRARRRQPVSPASSVVLADRKNAVVEPQPRCLPCSLSYRSPRSGRPWLRRALERSADTYRSAPMFRSAERVLFVSDDSITVLASSAVWRSGSSARCRDGRDRDGGDRNGRNAGGERTDVIACSATSAASRK